MAFLIHGKVALRFIAVFCCILVVVQSSKHFSPIFSATNELKMAQLPAPTPGILGLSPLIQPIHQINNVAVYYPGSYFNPSPDKNETMYFAFGYIHFRCIQPTKRIVVNANPEWKLRYADVTFNITEKLVVNQVFFNSDDETFYVDLVENMKIGVEYELYLEWAPCVIGPEDVFGIQTFNRTRQDTGDVLFTTSLSGAPKAMRRFVSCFDDPAYVISYKWIIRVYYGIQTAAIAMMNGPRSGVRHSCFSGAPYERGSEYNFDFPSMAIEATQLRIVPFAWYSKNDGVTFPPSDCF